MEFGLARLLSSLSLTGKLPLKEGLRQVDIRFRFMLDQLLLFLDSSLDILLRLVLLVASWSLALADNVAQEFIKAAIDPFGLLLVLGLHSLTR